MPELVTTQEFSDSAYGSLEDQIDTPISTLLDAAEAHIQNELRRKIKLATYTEVLRPETNTIFLKQRPIVSVTSITRSLYPQGPLWDPLYLDRLYINAESGYLDPSYPVAGYYVTIVYQAGFSVIPADIKQAVILQAAIIASPDYELLGVGDGREPGTAHIQRTVEALIRPYMNNGII